MTSQFTSDPKRIDWQKTGIFAVVVVVAVVLLFTLSQCNRPPKPDPNLGKAMQASTASKGAETQAVTEKAVPEMRERVQAPIRKRTEKARHYAAKIEAAAPPAAGAVHVPDDDAYRGLCQPGGVYQGHPERGRECRKLKG
jgi:hypothetical protein